MTYEQAILRIRECATEWHLFPDSFPLVKEIEKCLTSLLAAQAAELAEAKAEVERVKENRDYWHKSCTEAWEQRDFSSAKTRILEQELAAANAARETLEARSNAAERIIAGCGLLRVGCADIIDAQCDGKYEVENTETGDVLGEENEDGEFESRLFADWYEAYQAAIAAGWISTTGDGK